MTDYYLLAAEGGIPDTDPLLGRLDGLKKIWL